MNHPASFECLSLPDGPLSAGQVGTVVFNLKRNRLSATLFLSKQLNVNHENDGVPTIAPTERSLCGSHFGGRIDGRWQLPLNVKQS
jgi:hypothetical protein